jgi:hypothetical protein
MTALPPRRPASHTTTHAAWVQCGSGAEHGRCTCAHLLASDSTSTSFTTYPTMRWMKLMLVLRLAKTAQLSHPQSRFTPPYGAGEALGMGARPHRMGQGSPLYGGTKLGGPQKNFSRWAPLGPSNSRPPLGPPFALTRLTRGLGARGIGRR